MLYAEGSISQSIIWNLKKKKGEKWDSPTQDKHAQELVTTHGGESIKILWEGESIDLTRTFP